MPRDGEEPLRRAGTWLAKALAWLANPFAGLKQANTRHISLSAKLLALTALFVMLAEILIFVPSIANYRVTWLTDRLTAARLASLAAEAAPGGVVPAALGNELLMTAQVRSVAIKTDDMRRLVLPPDTQLTIDESYDLRGPSEGFLAGVAFRFGLIVDALSVFITPPGRTILVFGHPMMAPSQQAPAHDFVEIVLSEAPLRAAMVGYGLNILALSIVISIIAAALVYVALNALLVRPMMRLTTSMLYFGENPEDASRIIAPSERTDEIGIAERQLAAMQTELRQLLHQKNRLAQLGLAVAKINHDLRNMLANAQLISDRLSTLPDPAVQRFSPKLIGSLDRAIRFCNDILRYGRAEEAAPHRQPVRLDDVVSEVAEGLGLPRETVALELAIEPSLSIDADPDQIYRVLNNLIRNAAQVLESGQQPGPASPAIMVRAYRAGMKVVCEVSDNGPGIPPAIRPTLFKAFQSTQNRKGGTGLGLAISSELVAAHGGHLELLETDRGATFRFDIPDRRPAG